MLSPVKMRIDKRAKTDEQKSILKCLGQTKTTEIQKCESVKVLPVALCSSQLCTKLYKADHSFPDSDRQIHFKFHSNSNLNLKTTC